MLDPRKMKYKLTAEEKELALNEVESMYNNNGLLPLIVKLEAQLDMEPFKKIMFGSEILSNVTALQWWCSQKEIPAVNQNIDIIKQFLCAMSSSASVERVFSSFGIVHSKLRNKLGIEKAGKLVFLFKYYNCKATNE